MENMECMIHIELISVPSSILSTATRQHTKNRSRRRALCGVIKGMEKVGGLFPSKSYYH